MGKALDSVLKITGQTVNIDVLGTIDYQWRHTRDHLKP